MSDGRAGRSPGDSEIRGGAAGAVASGNARYSVPADVTPGFFDCRSSSLIHDLPTT